MTSIELRQARAELIAQSKEWLTRSQADNLPEGEIDTEWAKRNAEIDRLEAESKRAERAERMESLTAGLSESTGRKTAPTAPARTNAPASKGERNKVLKAWLSHGSAAGVSVDGDVMTRAADMGMPLHQPNVSWRSLNTGTATAGGNTTFTTTYPDLQTELKFYSQIMGRVQVIPTDNGNGFTLPRGSDVNNHMVAVNQGGNSPTTPDPTFDKVQFGATMFRGIELVTYEMLQDAVFDVEGWLNARIAERYARTVEKHVVAGTGTNQPLGLVGAAVAADGGTAAVTLAATKKNFYQFEDLMALFAAVDLAYRPNCTLVLSDSAVWDLRKIKDTTGRYIWDINNTLVQNAQPDSIAGFKYLVSNSVDATGAFSKNIAVFADLSRYVFRQVSGFQVTRLDQLYRAQGCIGVEFLARYDGQYIGHASSIARVATPAS